MAGHRFIKGQSGNLKGRPKVKGDVVELCRAYTTDAVELLVKILKNEEEESKTRAYAANSILDRGWGKPAQAMEVSGQPENPIMLQFVDVPKQESMEEWIKRQQAKKQLGDIAHVREEERKQERRS